MFLQNLQSNLTLHNLILPKLEWNGEINTKYVNRLYIYIHHSAPMGRLCTPKHPGLVLYPSIHEPQRCVVMVCVPQTLSLSNTTATGIYLALPLWKGSFHPPPPSKSPWLGLYSSICEPQRCVFVVNVP